MYTLDSSTRRNHRRATLLRRLALLLVFTLVTVWPAASTGMTPVMAQTVAPAATFATTITVDTVADLNPTSSTQTCGYTQGALFTPAGDGCTLRRALLEASARPDSDRPIAIEFDLPNGAANGDGTWTLPVESTALVLTRKNTLSDLGQVTIDGNTQTGGRSDGPKIIIDTNDHSLEIESEDNILRNLAFQGGGVIFLKAGGNTVEDIWMGLSNDGQEIIFRTPGNPMRMAGGGIDASSDNNTIQNNVISGAFAKAIDLQGDNNVVQNNFIGTRADGTVPTVPALSQCQASLSFDNQDWYGGWGIALSGTGNKILNNRIAGLQTVRGENDTSPLAIEIFGADHIVTDNIIGVDANDNEVGVCGIGIKYAGSGTQILDNTIVKSRESYEAGEDAAIFSGDSSPLFGQVTVRRNIVKDSPGYVLAFGGKVDPDLRLFTPAKITSINGTAVKGTNGSRFDSSSNQWIISECPGCLIDFYLDDDDAIGEALEHLGSTTADGDGNFTFVLPRALTASEGIRTSSTSQQSNVIPGFGAGTTTEVSKLFYPISNVTINGPTSGEVSVSYPFSITVGPVAATTPFTYTIAATDKSPQVLSNESGRLLNGAFGWATPGVKTIDVTVANDLGSLTASHQITITAPVDSSPNVYLPLITD